MRVLQINASYKPAFIYGGPTMSVSGLSEQLAKSGCLIKVFTTTANGQAELPVVNDKELIVDGVEVRYFKRITKDHSHFSPALPLALWKEARSFDVIHIHAWWNLVSMLACLVAIWRKVPVVLSPRGTLSRYSFQHKNASIKSVFHNLIGKPLLKRCHFHVTSGREENAIKEILTPKSITSIFNFVKLPEHSVVKTQRAMDHLKLIFFSRIDEKKGLDLLLEALTLVTVPFSFTVAGDGDTVYINSLKAVAAKNNLLDKIEWIGFQSKNKFATLASHDLMVLASHDENFGNVVIESLAVGTPVLISPNVGLADYVINGKAGWICGMDPKDIAAKICEIYQERQKLTELRAKLPAIINQDFEETALVKQYIDLYNKVITQH